MGAAPFGQHPAGSFDFTPPEHVVYVEPFPRRVRGHRGEGVVVDSEAVLLVHETGTLPHYAFPGGDVTVDGEPEPHAPGYVTVAWDSVDEWYEEDERVEVHPRDPYHRIDTFATTRAIQVSLSGIVLAESRRAHALFETSLPVRWYLPRDDVRLDLLEDSPTITRCAYKGTARHWSARVNGEAVDDIAWGYGDDEVWREGEPVRGLLAFYNELVDLEIDGVPQERPVSPWSR